MGVFFGGGGRFDRAIHMVELLYFIMVRTLTMRVTLLTDFKVYITEVLSIATM